MKLIKLTDDHYVVVDDSEIKYKDWYLDDTNQVRMCVVLDTDYWKSRKEYKKITHSTQPVDNVNGFPAFIVGGIQELSLQEVKELIGEVGVNEKAYKYAVDYRCPATNDQEYCKHDIVSAYNNGYNQALEDNKEKKYTEADLLHAFREGVLLPNSQIGIMEDIFKQVVQSLQPKTEWEVELETIDNRQPCHCQCHNNIDMVHFVACCNNGWIGKITHKLKLK